MQEPTSDPSPADGPKSQFTHRDLTRLGKYSQHFPLRVIALVDYDAFYAQCQTVRLKLPASQPLAVQQWHAIIALNYPARGHGFSRGASVEEVKKLCPNIVLQHVATWREGESSWAYREDASDPEKMKKDKAALDPYRIESRRSLNVITNHLPPAPLQRIEKLASQEDPEKCLPLPSQDHRHKMLSTGRQIIFWHFPMKTKKLGSLAGTTSR
ncbi:uncharacterized protein RCO7_08694 [Rhynchosporium graminicola]|uniref:UmuC domain-containing protein n=1 Tax=Rhynchosporium graminicola TaxID=2792576 RepID=A0A1E1LMG1_9HELO|nr:uncharacterized protein RCO7_08694 [Rhynchosporium commune]